MHENKQLCYHINSLALAKERIGEKKRALLISGAFNFNSLFCKLFETTHITVKKNITVHEFSDKILCKPSMERYWEKCDTSYRTPLPKITSHILLKAISEFRNSHFLYQAKQNLCRENEFYLHENTHLFYYTSDNQRLRSAGDNNRRSKRFFSNAVLCVSFN